MEAEKLQKLLERPRVDRFVQKKLVVAGRVKRSCLSFAEGWAEKPALHYRKKVQEKDTRGILA